MKEDNTQIDPTWMEKTGGYAKDMTLRDHFAGLAMQGLMANGTLPKSVSDEELAYVAYTAADEMLKESNHQKSKEVADNKLHNTSVGFLILTMRAKNCLRAGGIKTLGELLQCSRSNLMRIPNLGKSTLIEIEEMLAHLNLKLKDN